MLSIGQPLLAVVDMDAEGDGIAYAGRLFRMALDDLAGRAVPVITLGTRPERGGPSYFDRVRFAARLARRQRDSVDWVMFNHIGLARAQAAVPGVWRRPYAVVLNGVEAWDAAMGDGRRRAIRAASLRLAISAYTANRAAAAHPDLGPIVACPLGLIPPAASGPSAGVDAALVARVRPPAAVIVGRMSVSERYKGHDELLEAWPAVTRAVPGAQLVVVGRGDDEQRLRSKAAGLELGEQIVFTGFVSNGTRAALLRASTAFVLPSRGEGFGFVYVEAMGAGLPCIACQGGAAAELILDGQTGILIQPGSAPDLIRGLSAVLANPAFARQMGEAGRRRYDAEFTYDRFRARLGAALGLAFPSGGAQH